MNLKTPLIDLQRIGTIRSSHLARLGLTTVEDLLFYFPFRYDDFRVTTRIADIEAGQTTTVVGELQLIQNKRSPRRRMYITEALISDGTEMLRVIWFNQPFLTKNLRVGETLSLAGRISEDYGGIFMNSPVYEKVAYSQAVHTQGLIPLYHLTSNISQKQLRSAIKQIINLADEVIDWVPAEIVKKYKLLGLADSIRYIHFPQDPENLQRAKERLSFNELLLLQLRASLQRQAFLRLTASAITFFAEETKALVKDLPFALTVDQKKTAWEIIQDVAKTKPMIRLLQGDVGSGKTVVACLAAYNTALNKKQAVCMVPTEILAFQHFTTFATVIFSKTNLTIALRTRHYNLLKKPNSEVEKIEKKELAILIASGQVDIVVGTHALLQEAVQFKDLALVIIDEQHRFGVEQRSLIVDKGGKGILPHLLSMTATPIPRSLALALYGDLDISLIKQMPVGRKKIITEIVTPDQREKVYQAIVTELLAGRQAFIVCPLIDPSDKLGARSVMVEFKRLDTGVFKNFKVGLLHGRLPASRREEVMQAFVAGEVQLLIATSVIEIGVDIPNASVMMVEDADRFGLAQLHQYRGRVGRSDQQSYCFLMTENPDPRSNERLKAMSEFDSGFDLARADLHFRGPGEVYGLEQKGFPELKMANFYDIELMKKAREGAGEIIKSDITLRRWPLLKKELGEGESRAHLE